MLARAVFGCLVGFAAAQAAHPQAIEFESKGLKFQTLTRNNVTVMFAHMPSHVREFSIVQVTVSNGGTAPYVIRPEDFTFVRSDGNVIRAAAARYVVGSLIEKGSRNDVIKLVASYEATLYGIQQMRSTNGYEQRRQQALAEVSSTKLTAAAAASAIALVHTKLTAGQSTDGAVFFPTDGKPLGPGRLVVRNAAGIFEFNAAE